MDLHSVWTLHAIVLENYSETGIVLNVAACLLAFESCCSHTILVSRISNKVQGAGFKCLLILFV